MKNLIYLLCVLLFVSCGAEEAKEVVAEKPAVAEERSIGFLSTLPDDKWHLGTEAPIKIVKDLDKFWAASEFTAMRPLLSDTARFYFADGRKASSPDEFIETLKADESSDTWTFDYVYSVDLVPGTGGEHVQAGFTGISVDDGDTTNTHYHESYYIIEGKIVRWVQYSNTPKKEE